MNIFLIPSWYPTEESPITGRFFKEQALVYAKEYTQDRVIISRWGQGEFILNFASPLQAIKKLISYFKARYFQNKLAENVIEFYTPAFELRPRHCFGDIANIIKKNFYNFEMAQKYYGTIDVIHAHVVFPAGFVAMQLARHFQIPYVITEHMGPFPFPFFLTTQKQLQERLKQAYRNASNVIAVSVFLRDQMAAYGIKVHSIIPNLVDDDFFTLRKIAQDSHFNIIVLGRVTKMKGIDLFLRAFALAFSLDSSVKAKIGGSGEIMESCKTLCHELKIESQVDFLGELDAQGVKHAFQESHILVNASLYETFSVVISEALCSGIPVVTTDCGGPSMMCHTSNSITVASQDCEALAKAMKTMQMCFNLYDAKRIRDEHLLSFGKEHVTQRLREIYIQTIKDDDVNSQSYRFEKV